MSIGHKLTIKGNGNRGTDYKVELDDRPLDVTNLELRMGVHDANTATITIFVNELDAEATIVTPAEGKA